MFLSYSFSQDNQQQQLPVVVALIARGSEMLFILFINLNESDAPTAVGYRLVAQDMSLSSSRRGSNPVNPEYFRAFTPFG